VRTTLTLELARRARQLGDDFSAAASAKCRCQEQLPGASRVLGCCSAAVQRSRSPGTPVRPSSTGRMHTGSGHRGASRELRLGASRSCLPQGVRRSPCGPRGAQVLVANRPGGGQPCSSPASIPPSVLSGNEWLSGPFSVHPMSSSFDRKRGKPGRYSVLRSWHALRCGVFWLATGLQRRRESRLSRRPGIRSAARNAQPPRPWPSVLQQFRARLHRLRKRVSLRTPARRPFTSGTLRRHAFASRRNWASCRDPKSRRNCQTEVALL